MCRIGLLSSIGEPAPAIFQQVAQITYFSLADLGFVAEALYPNPPSSSKRYLVPSRQSSLVLGFRFLHRQEGSISS